jgi:hypothetical protein
METWQRLFSVVEISAATAFSDDDPIGLALLRRGDSIGSVTARSSDRTVIRITDFEPSSSQRAHANVALPDRLVQELRHFQAVVRHKSFWHRAC